MFSTKYARANSLGDALERMRAAEDGKFLGGGQTLLATMKQRLAAPSDVIDLTKIPDLHGILVNEHDVIIGAASTHAVVADHAGIAATIPALSALAANIGDPAVRTMGTLGGVLANNDPAADYPAAALALRATIHTSSASYPADDYFTGMFDTALDEDEVIVRVSFPIPLRAAYEKFRNPASRYAICGVMVAELSDGTVRVAVTGAGADGVFRVPEMEAALSGNFAPDAARSVAVDPGDILADMHGSSEYRAHLIPVLAARAVAKAGGA